MFRQINTALVKYLLTRHFRKTLREGRRDFRMVGLELEVPITKKSGVCGDYREILDVMVKHNWKPILKGGVLVGAIDPFNGTEIVAEVGVPLLEINAVPEISIHQILRSVSDTMRRLVEFAGSLDLFLLGYGIQPMPRSSSGKISLPSDEFLFPHPRYEAMFKAQEEQWRRICSDSTFHSSYYSNSFIGYKGMDEFMSARWCNATITASLQPHVEVFDDVERIGVLGLYDRLSPLLGAFFANSPVVSDMVAYKALARLLWIFIEPNQSGMYEKSIDSFKELMARYLDSYVFIRPKKGIYEPVHSLLRDVPWWWLLEDAFCRQVRGTFWKNGRLTDKTFEFRCFDAPTCSDEKLTEIGVIIALCKGLIVNWRAISEYLDSIGYSHGVALSIYEESLVQGRCFFKESYYGDLLWNVFVLAQQGIVIKEDAGLLDSFVDKASLFAMFHKTHPAEKAFESGGTLSLVDYVRYKF